MIGLKFKWRRQDLIWLLSVIILILILSVIALIVILIKDKQNATNYLSYISSISSIILAIVAIIYSFIQTKESHSNNLLLQNMLYQISEKANEISKVGESLQILKNEIITFRDSTNSANLDTINMLNDVKESVNLEPIIKILKEKKIEVPHEVQIKVKEYEEKVKHNVDKVEEQLFGTESVYDPIALDALQGTVYNMIIEEKMRRIIIIDKVNYGEESIIGYPLTTNKFAWKRKYSRITVNGMESYIMWDKPLIIVRDNLKYYITRITEQEIVRLDFEKKLFDHKTNE